MLICLNSQQIIRQSAIERIILYFTFLCAFADVDKKHLMMKLLDKLAILLVLLYQRPI